MEEAVNRAVTIATIARFEQALSLLADDDTLLRRMERNALQSQLDDLRSQLNEAPPEDAA
jgi:hypothetical protein